MSCWLMIREIQSALENTFKVVAFRQTDICFWGTAERKAKMIFFLIRGRGEKVLLMALVFCSTRVRFLVANSDMNTSRDCRICKSLRGFVFGILI